MQTNGFFEDLGRRAKAAIPINDNDYYGDDGLIYCGDCKTPKQVTVTLSGEPVTFMCLCKCLRKKRDREREKMEEEQRRIRIRELTAEGMQDAKMRSWTFENDDGSNPELIKVCRNYVDNFEYFREHKKGLLLFGSVGTGKTFAAGCIANALIQKGIPCMMTSFPELVNRFAVWTDKADNIASLSKFPLLVIDDLSSERNTAYMNEIIYTVIDARYRDGQPIIVTTNLSGQEIKNAAEIAKQRVYSRLLEMCVPYEVKGADRRKEKLKDEYTGIRKMLGLDDV